MKEFQLLRIYCTETLKIHGRPVYEIIIDEAYKHGIAGVTVLRGIAGYGSKRQLHTVKLLELSEDLPVIIEIIDSKNNLKKIIPFIKNNLQDHLVTTEDVKII